MENVVDWFLMISFIFSIASLILAVAAILIALYIKGEADKISQKTLLSDSAKSIRTGEVCLERTISDNFMY